MAIARALAIECSILVLDEPTAALPEADVEQLLEVLRRLRSEGMGIVYVRTGSMRSFASPIGSRCFVTAARSRPGPSATPLPRLWSSDHRSQAR